MNSSKTEKQGKTVAGADSVKSAESESENNKGISLKDFFNEREAKIIEVYCKNRRKWHMGRLKEYKQSKRFEKDKQSKLKRGDVVHPWGLTISICTRDPYDDPEERKKQVDYWLQKRNIELSENGKLIKVVPLRYNRSYGSIMGNEEYTYPIEMIRFKETDRLEREIKEVKNGELTISWSEITVKELIELTQALNGTLQINGDQQVARILYEASE